MLIVDDERSAESASENAEKIVSTKKDHKKKHKGLKKQNELLREQNELLKKRNELLEASKRIKGFFSQVGKAFCKALPGILTTFANAAIGYFFNTKGRRAKAAA